MSYVIVFLAVVVPFVAGVLDARRRRVEVPVRQRPLGSMYVPRYVEVPDSERFVYIPV